MTTQVQLRTRNKAPTVEREPLSWLFAAFFDDGSTIEQDQADQSTTGNGSTFTDVLAKDKQHSLTAFELRHVDGSQFVTVDLVTGAFIINGTPCVFHDQHFNPIGKKLRLIYFRETRIDQKINKAGQPVENKHYVNRYFIGWQTTAGGKNHKATLGVG